MRKKAVCSKLTAILLAAGMIMGMVACQGNSSGSTEEQRRSAESIKEDNLHTGVWEAWLLQTGTISGYCCR